MIIMACLTTLAAACGAPPAAPTATPATATAPIEIVEAWAAATPEAVTISAGYMTISNSQAAPDTLTALESPRAGRAEVHEMEMSEGVMRMRRMESLLIEPGQSVELAPGGAHLMFYDLTTPFVEGEEIPVTLHFAQAGAVTVDLPVRARGGGAHRGH